MSNLLVQLRTQTAQVPTRATWYAAGYDICSDENVIVPPHTLHLVSTGISIATPPGTYGQLMSRSGLVVKKWVTVEAGVIDADYRGEVKVALFNHGDLPFEIKQGDRIAQLILNRIDTPTIRVLASLDSTERGENGFGSTGVKNTVQNWIELTQNGSESGNY